MSDVIQIIIAKYASPALAEAAVEKLQDAKENQGIHVKDAAVVRRGENGKLHIHETDDVTASRGATAGGILGGVLGIIAGPAGLVVGAALGAAVGGVAARAIDTGIPHRRLEAIGATLLKDGAALVVLTEAGFVPFIQAMIGGREVEVYTEAIDAEAAARLGRDHDVAVKALNLGESLADGGMGSPAGSD